MRVVLAHGASGDAESMRAHVEGLRRRGAEAVAIDLPRGKAERAVPVYRTRIEELAEAPGGLVIGGQSYGGRVATLLASEQPDVCTGIVLFSYPLHRPGEPDWDERSRHWPFIRVPMLFLSGESDPFARLELLRRAIEERRPDATLVSFAGQGHSLRPVLDEALDRVAGWLEERFGAAEGD